MMHLKNISAGNPKTMAQFQLTKRSGVIWLYSEDGKNWYDEQKNFAADTLKIAYDQNGVIVNISQDVSTINPTGLSVVELPNITANRRADIYGGWVFDGEKIIKRVYTSEELRQQAEVKKLKLLEEAEAVITPLARAVKLDIATDEERQRLEVWEQYSVLVNRVDTSKPDWPERPASQ
ncbi:TPA: tail fiber assembly protein [Salmonella enterica subsp. enterica serovar Mississippi]|uniref:Tail fiber assembly protein n=1 Tax=Salmonella enterica I TaxID=59201 RepID=A0A3V2XHZ3_SALET|nr:tail fiber assembly protein [Salmonella enterica]EAA7383352.1 tail fiber assembly protein [Salmonella enterica subsp. enterica]EBF8287262.1 tail fiber assembly protein [Salmonella enterica subsp. houtenae]ECU3286910.1 tail fiber assembly protein [Salmonella enterica subsp. houtenae serovar Houten]EDS4966597.1 tail fiber assembly protein [Salmonella enterica subsp. enterica serovar O rough]EHA4051490.1 tail fiber assembly protein [Salmonella enterica subsp. enterica serovar Farmingdale]HEC7